MSDNIKREIDKIKVPEQISQRSKLGIEQARSEIPIAKNRGNKLPLIISLVASLFIIVGLSMFLTNNNVKYDSSGEIKNKSESANVAMKDLADSDMNTFSEPAASEEPNEYLNESLVTKLPEMDTDEKWQETIRFGEDIFVLDNELSKSPQQIDEQIGLLIDPVRTESTAPTSNVIITMDELEKFAHLDESSIIAEVHTLRGYESSEVVIVVLEQIDSSNPIKLVYRKAK